MKRVFSTIGSWFRTTPKKQTIEPVSNVGHSETHSFEQATPQKEEFPESMQYSEEPVAEVMNEPKEHYLTDKQYFMLKYVRNSKKDWVSPTEVGREFGMQIKGVTGWGSQHSSKILTGLVKLGFLEKSEIGHYRAV